MENEIRKEVSLLCNNIKNRILKPIKKILFVIKRFWDMYKIAIFIAIGFAILTIATIEPVIDMESPNEILNVLITENLGFFMAILLYTLVITTSGVIYIVTKLINHIHYLKEKGEKT